MSTIHDAVESYLALRRGLGAELKKPGTHLRRFAEFVDNENVTVVTSELALRWATESANATAATWAQRLADVRRFLAWLSTIDPSTEVPPHGLLPERYRRRPPYIYSDEEVARIVSEAVRLPSSSGLRGHTYSTILGLLAATGLRHSEALALDRDDVDLRAGAGVLAVRLTKFGKSRFVPIHESTRRAMKRYARKRDLCLPSSQLPAFFLSERGTRITQGSSCYNFAIVSRAVGLRPPGPRQRHGRGPRLHDMRHRLAARTLIRWYREGRDVERELPKLSTYLGHVHVADTYWYLEAVPELLQLATERAASKREDAP